MKIEITASQPNAAVKAPPSKSYAHRMLICAGLSHGTSRISGISGSQDMLATIDCLKALGAEINSNGETLEIKGTDPRASGSAVFMCRESGSTLRFFVPLCALSGNRMTLTGAGRLMSRPLSVYEKLFAENGLIFERYGDRIVLQGPLRAGEYSVDASVSSQFVTGLLLALPLTDGDSIIRLVPPVSSRSYIDMTIASMRQFGVTADWDGDLAIRISGGQTYSAADITVPGDWSNAAFLIAMGMEVPGLDSDSIQGDSVCTEHFRTLDEGFAEINIDDCPDLGPVLMAYAAMRHGVRLTGTDRLRHKESDRGEAMKQELAKFGADVRIGDDTITVGSGIHAPEETLYGHNDHRIVMALSVLCAQTGGIIDGAEAVEKSFPDFFDRIREAGIRIYER